MGKHETIKGSLLRMTRARSVKRALEGWCVKKHLSLPRTAMETCELCGTAFCRGALVHHEPSGSTVTIGRNCLQTVLLKRFSVPKKMGQQRRTTLATIRQVYRGIVDPGAWMTWIIQNAPRRFAHVVTYLDVFGTTPTPEDLQKLIRFHDNNRLYHRASLLDDWQMIGRSLDIEIPQEITLAEARLIQKRLVRHQGSFVERREQKFFRCVVKPSIEINPALAKAWGRLGANGRRAAIALAVLSDTTGEDEEVCGSDLAALWPFSDLRITTPTLIWNSRFGLGLTGDDLEDVGQTTAVWLWREDDARRFDLRFWRQLEPCKKTALRDLELLACGCDGAYDRIKGRLKQPTTPKKHRSPIKPTQEVALTLENATPLHLAVRDNNSKSVAALLSTGARVDALGPEGLTPLHLAAKMGHLTIACLLVENGANTEATSLGRTALQLATESGHAEIARLLTSGKGVNAATP